MNETVTRSRRLPAVVVMAVVLLVAGGLAAWRAGVFGRDASPPAGEALSPPATQVVTRQDLSASTPLSATLGYAGSYVVAGVGGGTLTWLPAAGRVVGQGGVLYRVDDGVPVVLLYGAVPDWRVLAEGVSGADVGQLNRDLVALGYASGPAVRALGWDYFSRVTGYGVRRLEERLGVSDPPSWLALGSVVFEPGALRVTQLAGALGGQAAGPVLDATSDRHVVTIGLETSMESEVAAGDAVTVTLPDGSGTAGVVTSVGTVATAAPSGSGGPATVPVQVRLTDPAAAGSFDQAPVTVYITTGSVRNALAVPVAALLARSSGGYAVEVAGPDGARRLVPVTAGIFDDNSGLVQVTGALVPGERVVVAGS